jgi:hypothetical protein
MSLQELRKQRTNLRKSERYGKTDNQKPRGSLPGSQRVPGLFDAGE